jgi:hypothetical protein
LPVKKVNFVKILIVERFVREILFIAIQIEFYYFSNNFPFYNIINKMIMCLGEIMKETNKNFVVSYKTAYNIGVRKVLICHCPVIYTYEGVDIQLIFLYFRLSSLDFPEVSKHPFAVIKIRKSILITG